MRTVKEILQDCDREQFIATYNCEHPISLIFLKEEDAERTAAELIANRNQFLNGLIDRLISQPDKSVDYILYAEHKYSQDLSEDVQFVLAETEKIMAGDIFFPVSCILFEHSDIANIKVAETYTTKYYLYELMAYVLHEASWFGPEQEMKAEFEESLTEKGEYYSVDEVRQMIEDEYGIEFEKRDAEEEELEMLIRKRITELEIEYNSFCRKRELAEVRKLVYQ